MTWALVSVIVCCTSGVYFLVFLVLLLDASVEDAMLMSRTDLFGRPNSHLFTVDANLIM